MGWGRSFIPKSFSRQLRRRDAIRRATLFAADLWKFQAHACALCGVQFGVLRVDAIWPSGYYGLVLVLLGFLPLGSLRILFFAAAG